MFQPGADYNYPTSSGNAPSGFLAQSFNLSGVHISFAMIGVVLLILIVWNMAKKRR